jgi:aspartyl-tRNA(Asn)/glutamyl-tRNA(Gln) amidotransferase subunit A
VKVLAGLGAKIEEITLPDYELFSACGRIIMFSEAFAIHEEDFRRRPLDFGLLTYQRMALGAFVTATDLIQATRLRRELALTLNRRLQHCDAIVTASALAPAPRFDTPQPRTTDSPIQAMPYNVTGNPAMSVPTGLSAAGLPLSMQIVGRLFDEPNPSYSSFWRFYVWA